MLAPPGENLVRADFGIDNMDIGEYLGVACNSTPSIRKIEDQGQGNDFCGRSLFVPFNVGCGTVVFDGGAFDYSKQY